jgi:hypothetical protein
VRRNKNKSVIIDGDNNNYDDTGCPLRFLCAVEQHLRINSGGLLMQSEKDETEVVVWQRL